MKTSSALLMLSLTAMLSQGCQQDPYALVVLGDAQLAEFGPLPDGGPPCVRTNEGIEICDEIDNDCNGLIDDPFNLRVDPENCGECGVSCLKNGALSLCELGKCKDLGCAPGFYDHDGEGANGCEYECTPSGPEICDEADNDCNGEIDETFDLSTDVANCGKCDQACALANATPKCVKGQCLVQSCLPGFIDVDDVEANGCEQPCVKSNAGVEVCDGKDNDCNGVVDDPGGLLVDFQTDPFNCGGCNVKCVLANATTLCVEAKCVLDTCKGDHKNADGDNGNGCECLATGVETCDGVDNDCNGLVDDALPPLGVCGSNIGECQTGELICQNGVAFCVDATGPKPELCDGKDNDCNRQIDDKLPPSLGVCGNDVGECQQGSLICEGGEPVCKNAVVASVEVCDGKDNDCNALVDDGLASNLGVCGNAVGECQEGHLECQGGVRVCVNATGPVAEFCDGKDNDCSGTVDDGLPPSLGACGSSVGECQLGSLVCQLGTPTCTGDVGPVNEACDGKDNDCNRQVDDGLPSNLGPCGSAMGECQEGHHECQGGVEVCVESTGPKPETCDGKDNDCNTFVDDKLPPSLGICGSDVGECRTGNLVCQLGTPTCTGDVRPVAELCDDKDNDCNTLVDDGLPASFGFCGSATGECSQGTLQCVAGAQICVNAVGPKTEYCDGTDTDCDGADDDADCVFTASGREERLSEPTETLGSHNSAQLTLACDESDVLTLWLDRRNDPQADLYGNRSSDSAASWLSADVAVATEAESKVEPALSFGGPTATSKRVYLAYARYTTGGRRDVYFRRSSDGGATWQSPLRLDSLSNDSLFVRLAVHPGASATDADHVVVCWEEINTSGVIQPNVRCNLSQDSGSSFSGDRRVNRISGDAILPEIAIDSGHIYVAWQQGASINVARAALATTPLSFADEATLSSQPGKEPKVATDGGGVVLVVWEDLRAPLSALRGSRSTNWGASWPSDGVRIDNDVVDGDSVDPVVAFRPGGRAFVAWADTSRGAHDIYTNSSADGGATWGAVAQRVSGGVAGAVTSSSPRLAVSATGSRVYVAWEDLRDGTQRDVYVNQSLDDGVTWNVPDARVDEALPAGASDAREPQLCIAGSQIVVAWVENRSGSAGSYTTGANADIYASYLE
ncbi:MAG: exo-alpha-sialidase [Deltaproteobacteria bacterium]|nr:exo-alpha-sialidase [Deltaproteobacteria bacterium]